jgi:hypothetical protein
MFVQGLVAAMLRGSLPRRPHSTQSTSAFSSSVDGNMLWIACSVVVWQQCNRFLAWLALAAILVVLPYLVNPV